MQGLLGSGSGAAAQGLREDLASLLDESMMRQMVARDALGAGDLRPVLERLMDVLAALLAPVRLEAFRRWRDVFTSLAFPTNTSTSSTSVPVPESASAAAVVVTEPLSSKRSLIALAPLLGPFCEFIALTVEEVCAVEGLGVGG